MRYQPYFRYTTFKYFFLLKKVQKKFFDLGDPVGEHVKNHKILLKEPMGYVAEKKIQLILIYLISN